MLRSFSSCSGPRPHPLRCVCTHSSERCPACCVNRVAHVTIGIQFSSQTVFPAGMGPVMVLTPPLPLQRLGHLKMNCTRSLLTFSTNPSSLCKAALWLNLLQTQCDCLTYITGAEAAPVKQPSLYQGRAMHTLLNDATAQLTLDLLHLKYLLFELHCAVFASLSDLWAAMGV